MFTLVVRNNTKDSWSKAVPLPVLDIEARMEALAERLNESAGFRKYKSVPA